MYENVSGGIVTDKNATQQKTAFALKKTFTLDEKGGQVLAGEQITELVLEQATFQDKKFIQGRALYDIGKNFNANS
jgi:hypothetical protein